MPDRTQIGDEFAQRLTSIVEQLHRVFDLAETEDSMLQLLRFIEKHPSHTAEFQHIFRSFMQEDLRSVVEPLEFTMHTLKWPEIREALERIRDNPPNSASEPRWAARILDAYEPSWDNAILYSHYRRPDQPRPPPAQASAHALAHAPFGNAEGGTRTAVGGPLFPITAPSRHGVAAVAQPPGWP